MFLRSKLYSQSFTTHLQIQFSLRVFGEKCLPPLPRARDKQRLQHKSEFWLVTSRIGHLKQIIRILLSPLFYTVKPQTPIHEFWLNTLPAANQACKIVAAMVFGPVPNRPYHEAFMRKAIDMAELALASDETPVGCVFVHKGEIIGRGINGTNASLNVCQIIILFSALTWTDFWHREHDTPNSSRWPKSWQSIHSPFSRRQTSM